jgi:hypothetical protein
MELQPIIFTAAAEDIYDISSCVSLFWDTISDSYVDIGIWVTQEKESNFIARDKLSNTKLSCSDIPKV